MGLKLTVLTHEFGLPQEASRATPRVCGAHLLELDDSIEAIEHRSPGLLEMCRMYQLATTLRFPVAVAGTGQRHRKAIRCVCSAKATWREKVVRLWCARPREVVVIHHTHR
jgi:hypothetical protein